MRLLSISKLIVISVATPALAIDVYTTDFIPDNARTNFNGFEANPSCEYLYPYVEDGIEVVQVNGNVDQTPEIICHLVACGWSPPEGVKSWWPLGADHGYTRIRRSSGDGFLSVGFFHGTGHCPSDIAAFELWNHGALVLAGTVPNSGGAKYLGFSGGGFDEIRVRDAYPPAYTGFYDHTMNALAVDAIELRDITVPIMRRSWGQIRTLYR